MTFPAPARDAAGALLLLVVSLLPLGVPGVALGELDHAVPPWLPPVLVVAQTLPLAFRRAAPAAVLAVVGVGFAVAQLVGADTGLAGLGLFVAIYTVAAYQRRGRLVTDVVALAGYVALAVTLHAEGSPERLVDWVTFVLVLATPWFVGQLVRRRLAEQVVREALAAETAVREARVGLARDLHDVVTHHVTAMVVQADSAAYLDAADVAERAQTLETIGVTGRRALRELRSLLGALEQTSGTTASREPLAPDVAELVETARAGGYPVTLVGAETLPPLSEAVAVTLYRIAQESLTNAMKHAPGIPVAMELDGAGDVAVLRVRNDLGAAAPGPAGRGRRGMTERAALLGGRVAAGVVDGRFEVVATLDARAEAASARPASAGPASTGSSSNGPASAGAVR